MNQSEFEVITCNRRQARENARVQQVIGFGFASHWLRKWCERELLTTLIENCSIEDETKVFVMSSIY